MEPSADPVHIIADLTRNATYFWFSRNLEEEPYWVAIDNLGNFPYNNIKKTDKGKLPMSTICVSRLSLLLKERQMTVLSLQRELAQKGRIVNKNTLYRLNSKRPLKKVDLTIAAEICSLLQIGLADLFVIGQREEKEQKVTFTPRKKARVRALLELARKGKLTPAEETELYQLVDEEWEAAINAAHNAVNRQLSISRAG